MSRLLGGTGRPTLFPPPPRDEALGRPLTGLPFRLVEGAGLIGPGDRAWGPLPDGLVSGRTTRAIRERLVATVLRVVVVRPETSPSGGGSRESPSHVLVTGTSRGPGPSVVVCRIDSQGRAVDRIDLGFDQAIRRLDHDFHARRSAEGPTLSQLGAEVVRGSLERPTVAGVVAFHTGDFPEGDARLALRLPDDGPVVDRALVVAEAGDILVARVDRHLERKVCGILSGSIPLSSMVLRIRVSPPHRDRVLAALLSPEGEAALAATSRGAGARMLGRRDLEELPLPM